MIVRTQTVRFTPDRAPTPRKVKIGFEGDNMVERLCFKLPRIAENQTATMMLDGEYANMVILTEDEDRCYVDLTAELIGGDGEHEAYIVIDGGDTGEAWGSGTFALQVGEIPGFAGDIAERFPDAIEQLRSEIAGHRAEMQETSEDVKAEADAARAAVLAAENQAKQAGTHSVTAEAAASDAQEAKSAAQKSAEYAETLHGAVENGVQNALAASDYANFAANNAAQMSASAEIAAMRAEKAAQKTEDALSGGDDGQVLGKVNGEPMWIDLPEGGSGDVTTDALDAAIARHNASSGAHPDIRAMIGASGGGTGGAVASVNGKTGAVVLTAADVGALAEDKLQSAVGDALAQAKESGEFDGSDGIDGKDGKNGVDGSPGKDGVSVTHNWNGTTLTVTSASGTSSADLKGSKGDKGDKGDAGSVGLQGEKGETGATGPAGSDGIGIKSVAQTTTSSADGGSNVITVTKTDNTTSTFTVKNGRKGSTGPAGKTPVKGVDYYTPEDKTELTDIMTDTLREDAEFIAAVSEHAQLVKVAASPEFVNDISECTDTSKVYVLPNGHLCAYMQTEVTTEGETVPNFTNIFDTSKGAYIKDGYRYSHSNGNFFAEAETCAVVVPVPGGSWKVNQPYTLRVQGVTINGGTSRAKKIYVGNTSSDFTLPANAEAAPTTQADGTVVFTHTPNANDKTVNFSWLVFHVDDGVDASKLIVTFNEEISYTTTPGGTEIVTKWTDTGIEYNQPPDYTERVAALETKTARLRVDVDALSGKVSGGAGAALAADVLTVPAYAPPQLPADGSTEADFDLRMEASIDDDKTLTAARAYAYMDALVARKPTYMIKQTMGKDESGEYDCNRYILANTYWKAWYKDGNPPMFAWKNGSTVIYSLSVSPRIGDVMYSTGNVSTEYGAVSAVTCDTIAESTRTVNGLVFSRYADGDVEPVIFYTKPRQRDSNGTVLWCEIFRADFTSTYKGSYDVHTDYMISTSSDNNTKYIRYPFADKKADKSSPIPVFMWANEHGQGGDNRCPSVILMRMAKDLCENNHRIPFLSWLKDNCILTIIPVANPWGYESYLYDRDGYCNANYVNLNRNYDTPGFANFDNTTQWEGEEGAFLPGDYVGSENETQYLMNTLHLSKAKVAFSMHGIPSPSATAAPYNLNTTIKGCGFDAERARAIEETLWNDYNCQVSWSIDAEQDFEHCAKSCAYIQYHGVVGGLTETIDWEESLDETTGLAARYTAKVMEQGYTELLRCLQVWIEEALMKEES